MIGGGILQSYTSILVEIDPASGERLLLMLIHQQF